MQSFHHGCIVGHNIWKTTKKKKHTKNKCLFASKGPKKFVNLVCVKGLVSERKWRFLQSIAIFDFWNLINPWLISKTWIEGEKHTLQALEWLHELWDGKTMHCIIIQSIKVVIQKAKYLVINCDEVTTIDNQCWCRVHIYIVDKFKKISMLLNLVKVVGEGMLIISSN
jgi:hypothetical protein